MRGVLSTTLWWLVSAWAPAQGPLINEVVPGGGGSPDWIELYNPTAHAVDLMGHALVIPGRTHRIQTSMSLPAHGWIVLWCDRHPEKGPDHLDLKLPRSGGSLLLVGPDRRTVTDVYSWPTLPSGVSIGRLHDGGAKWGYFLEPTPGSSNDLSLGADRLLPPPSPRIEADRLTCEAPEGGWLRYTTDGRIPGPGSPEFTGITAQTNPGVITLRAFAPDALPSPPVPVTWSNEPFYVALRIDPDSLFDPVRGILAEGDAANFSRSGRSWQREAQVEWHSPDTVRREDVRMAVSGSGSRGLAKKNFKLFRQGEEEDEVMLRADATPHAFLRNLFIERIARDGAQVDIQPSVPTPLYINGRYTGLYRVMPAKNSAWLCSLSGAESVDLIDGPGGHALKGDDDHFSPMLRVLGSGGQLDSLHAMMEVTSLLDLTCFDLYTGRADHDLNVRCWRPRERGGRWRWILFDMDLWAPPTEYTVSRMCSATAPEAPYLPWVLHHDGLRPLLLARISAWLSTSLATDRASRIADSLYQANEVGMKRDFDRWHEDLRIEPPEARRSSLQEHIRERPAELLRQLSEYTGEPLRKISVRVTPPGSGMILFENLFLTDAERGITGFEGAPVHLHAQPHPGYTFVEWQGADQPGADIVVNPGQVRKLRAVFRLTDRENP